MYNGSAIGVSAYTEVTQAAYVQPKPNRVDVSVSVLGGQVTLTFSPQTYDSITVLVMGYDSQGNIWSEYRGIGAGVRNDYFYPSSSASGMADTATLESINGKGISPATLTGGVYYW